MYALLWLVAFASLGSCQNTSSPTSAAPSGAPTSAAPSIAAPSGAPTSSPTLAPTLTWEDIDIKTIEANLTCGMKDVAYRQYDKMMPPFCVVIDDQYYVAFYPNVDDFTLLEVEDSFGAPWLDSPQNNPVYIRAEVGTKSSFWRTRSQGTGAGMLTVPFWTIVIEVTNGLVDTLTWDDSCPLCSSSDLCVEGRNCGVPHTSCGNAASDDNCNLQIYVAWFGTDVDGNYFTSSDKRLSRFRSGSLAGAYASALTKANNIAAIANPIPALTGR